MADPYTISTADLEELKEALSTPALEPVLDRAGHEGKLGDVLALVEVGVAEICVSEESIATAVREFLKRGGGLADFERAKRRMFQAEKQLPEAFVDLPSPLDDLLRLECEMQELGTENYEVFRDQENLAALKRGGLAGMHMRKIKAGAVSELTGVPRDIVEKQPLKQSVQGTAFAQSVGHPEAVKDPAFWEDFKKVKSGKGDMSKADFTSKWLERAKQWSAEESERRNKENERAWTQYKMALIDRELERRHRERARREKIRARRKRRARNRARKRKNRKPGYTDWPVITPSRSQYFVRFYKNGATELYRVCQSGLQLVTANFAYYEERDPRTGEMGVRLILGARPRTPHPASPAQAPEGQRGPLGASE